MALTQCRECGKEVSTEATACPHCGAKPAKKVGKLGLIVAGAFLVYVLGSIVSRPALDPVAAKESAATAARAAAEKRMRWNYHTETDAVSGKSSAAAEVISGDANDLHSPYGPGVRATLLVRRHPRYGRDVIVSIDRGQLLCRSYGNPCRIMVRFDDRPAMAFEGAAPSDHSSDTVFVRGHDRFVAELKKAKTALIELPLYQDGQRSWTFNVAGFDAAQLK